MPAIRNLSFRRLSWICVRSLCSTLQSECNLCSEWSPSIFHTRTWVSFSCNGRISSITSIFVHVCGQSLEDLRFVCYEALHSVEVLREPSCGLEREDSSVSRAVIDHFHCPILFYPQLANYYIVHATVDVCPRVRLAPPVQKLSAILLMPAEIGFKE